MLMLIYFLIAVGVSFLCSILEAVLLSINSAHIKVIKRNNEPLGSLMEKQKEDIDLSIGAILTLNTFAHTLGAAGVGAEAAKVFGEEYMFYVSAILTLLILIFSEIIPKTIGAYYWKNLSGFCSRVIKILVLITYPLLILMKRITNFLTPDDKKTLITKEEISAAASIAHESGVIREKDSDLIENLLNLEDVRVKDIHTPRSVMVSLSKDELLDSFKNKKTKINLDKLKEYSRIPIYEDNIDNILGLVFSKEYFHEHICNQHKDKKELIKPVYKVNENIPISKLLDLFLSRKEQLFIVVDNYEQTEGVVTLEDAIETLLGIEIVDEHDKNIDMRELAKNRMKLIRNNFLTKKTKNI